MKRKTAGWPEGVRPVVLAFGSDLAFAWTAEGAAAERLVGRRGRILGIDWRTGGGLDSSLVFHDENGQVDFVRNREGPASERLRSWLEAGVRARAYSAGDPPLEAGRLASWMSRPESGLCRRAAEEVAPFAEEFLSGLDGSIVAFFESRPTTTAEYAFLAARPERRQAAALHQWLLPWMLCGLEKADPGPAERVLAAIDGRKELVPALCAELRVEANVVRSMSVLPLWRPGVPGGRANGPFDADAETVAKAFSVLAPEQRPDKRSAKRFLDVAAWAKELLSQSGNCGSSAACAHAAAETWKRIRRRPYELPAARDLSWISELAEAVGIEKGGKNEPERVSGTAAGERVRLPWASWAALWAVCSRHPVDQPSEDRKWVRRRMSASRELLREMFSPRFAFPAEYPDSHRGPDGWSAVRIATAGELAEQSELGQNCLACLTPRILRGQRFPYAAYGPDGILAGHFEIRESDDGSAVLGQVLALRNRAAPQGMKRLAESALDAFVRERGDLFPPPPGRDAKFLRAAKEWEERARLANGVAHAEETLSILAKTAAKFRIGFPGTPEEGEDVR